MPEDKPESDIDMSFSNDSNCADAPNARYINGDDMQIESTKYYQAILSIRKRYPYAKLSKDTREAFEKDLCLRLSWNTNSLEGNTLTLEETVDALEYDEVRSGHTYSEYTEAKNAYRANCELTFEEKRRISVNLIRQINGIIMGTKGEFRSRQVYVGSIAEVAWMPPRPEEITDKMEQWSAEVLNAFENTDCSAAIEKEQPDLAQNIRKIAKLHMQFEMIHPFQDGNGRTGRLIMNQMLLNAGLLPAVILNQSKYRQAFRIYKRNQNTALMEYCIAAGVAKTYEILGDICRKMGEPAEEQP